MNGSRGIRGCVTRGGASSVNSSISSVSAPRKALEKDLRGTKRPERVGFPAVGVAGTFGLAFGGVADELPKSLSKTLAGAFELEEGVGESSWAWQQLEILSVVIKANAKANSVLRLVL